MPYILYSEKHILLHTKVLNIWFFALLVPEFKTWAEKLHRVWWRYWDQMIPIVHWTIVPSASTHHRTKCTVFILSQEEQLTSEISCVMKVDTAEIKSGDCLVQWKCRRLLNWKAELLWLIWCLMLADISKLYILLWNWHYRVTLLTLWVLAPSLCKSYNSNICNFPQLWLVATFAAVKQKL